MISILIVCYNSKNDIERCLNSIYAQDLEQKSFEILLINNSKDRIEKLIESKYPEVIVVPNTLNHGFGKANNILARRANGDLLLLLNPDTELCEGAIQSLLDVQKRFPGRGAWGGATYLPDGKSEHSSLQISQSIINEIYKIIGLASFSAERREISPKILSVKVLSGAFMLVSRKVWNEIGGFDESFFMYSEEVDLCNRIYEQTGSDLILCERSMAIHYVGSSSEPSKRIMNIYRGKMHLARKNAGLAKSLIYFVLFWIYCASRACISFTAKSDVNRQRMRSFREASIRPLYWFYGYDKK